MVEGEVDVRGEEGEERPAPARMKKTKRSCRAPHYDAPMCLSAAGGSLVREPPLNLRRSRRDARAMIGPRRVKVRGGADGGAERKENRPGGLKKKLT